MIQYRITKQRAGYYLSERKAGLLSAWEYLGRRDTYKEAMSIVKEEQLKDAEGLPKVVWWCR